MVKNASDFRAEARAALKGNWWIGAVAGLMATLLGGSTVFNVTTIGDGGILTSVSQSLSQYPEEQRAAILLSGMMVSAVVFIINLVIFLIAGAFTLGYIRFNLKMLNGEKPKFVDMFSQFKRFGAGLGVHFFRWLFVLLWTLAGLGVAIVAMIPFAFLMVLGDVGVMLFMICSFGIGLAAGIFIFIKMMDYSLAPYIVYENPGIGGMEALKKSKRLMGGSKGRLFGLMLSFIGWSLLAYLPYLICLFFWKEAVLFSFPFCVGCFWLKAYQEASYAAFYKQIVVEREGYILGTDEKGVSDNNEFLNKLKGADSVVEQSRWNY